MSGQEVPPDVALLHACCHHGEKVAPGQYNLVVPKTVGRVTQQRATESLNAYTE